MLTKEIKEISAGIYQKLITVRREIHKYPELGFREYKTSALISNYLRDLGIEVSNVAQTGVLGTLKGKKAGKTVAVRSDIDALPITELNNFDFKSQISGVMHACGHDAHIAIVLGTAEVLSRLRHMFSGNVKFIFQPGEEGFGGARNMIEDGALRSPDVDAIIAAHVDPHLQTGQISIGSGYIMASQSEFDIELTGKSGHAALPHTTIDPISIGVNLINIFQSIINREKNPIDNAVLSVTAFNAGNTYNVIPETASLKGTVRTFDTELDKTISQRMEQITAALCNSMGARYRFSYKTGYPPVFNHKEIVEFITQCARLVLEDKNIIAGIKPNMLAEDFSYYVQNVPGALFNLGCSSDKTGIPQPLHSNKFNMDENCILTGVELMSQFIVSYLSI